MSIKNCLNKIPLSNADKAKVNEIYESLGKQSPDAVGTKDLESKAVSKFIETVDQDLNELADQIEQAGGEVSRLEVGGMDLPKPEKVVSTRTKNGRPVYDHIDTKINFKKDKASIFLHNEKLFGRKPFGIAKAMIAEDTIYISEINVIDEMKGLDLEQYLLDEMFFEAKRKGIKRVIIKGSPDSKLSTMTGNKELEMRGSFLNNTVPNANIMSGRYSISALDPRRRWLNESLASGNIDIDYFMEWMKFLNPMASDLVPMKREDTVTFYQKDDVKTSIEVNSMGFYSKMREVLKSADITGLKPSKKNPEGKAIAINVLKEIAKEVNGVWLPSGRLKGIKKEEFIWSGIADKLMKLGNERISRDELVAMTIDPVMFLTEYGWGKEQVVGDPESYMEDNLDVEIERLSIEDTMPSFLLGNAVADYNKGLKEAFGNRLKRVVGTFIANAQGLSIIKHKSEFDTDRYTPQGYQNYIESFAERVFYDFIDEYTPAELQEIFPLFIDDFNSAFDEDYGGAYNSTVIAFIEDRINNYAIALGHKDFDALMQQLVSKAYGDKELIGDHARAYAQKIEEYGVDSPWDTTSYARDILSASVYNAVSGFSLGDVISTVNKVVKDTDNNETLSRIGQFMSDMLADENFLDSADRKIALTTGYYIYEDILKLDDSVKEQFDKENKEYTQDDVDLYISNMLRLPEFVNFRDKEEFADYLWFVYMDSIKRGDSTIARKQTTTTLNNMQQLLYKRIGLPSLLVEADFSDVLNDLALQKADELAGSSKGQNFYQNVTLQKYIQRHARDAITDALVGSDGRMADYTLKQDGKDYDISGWGNNTHNYPDLYLYENAKPLQHKIHNYAMRITMSGYDQPTEIVYDAVVSRFASKITGGKRPTKEEDMISLVAWLVENDSWLDDVGAVFGVDDTTEWRDTVEKIIYEGKFPHERIEAEKVALEEKRVGYGKKGLMLKELPIALMKGDEGFKRHAILSIMNNVFGASRDIHTYLRKMAVDMETGVRFDSLKDEFFNIFGDDSSEYSFTQSGKRLYMLPSQKTFRRAQRGTHILTAEPSDLDKMMAETVLGQSLLASITPSINPSIRINDYNNRELAYKPQQKLKGLLEYKDSRSLRELIASVVGIDDLDGVTDRLKQDYDNVASSYTPFKVTPLYYAENLKDKLSQKGNLAFNVNPNKPIYLYIPKEGTDGRALALSADVEFNAENLGASTASIGIDSDYDQLSVSKPRLGIRTTQEEATDETYLDIYRQIKNRPDSQDLDDEQVEKIIASMVGSKYGELLGKLINIEHKRKAEVIVEDARHGTLPFDVNTATEEQLTEYIDQMYPTYDRELIELHLSTMTGDPNQNAITHFVGGDKDRLVGWDESQYRLFEINLGEDYLPEGYENVSRSTISNYHTRNKKNLILVVASVADVEDLETGEPKKALVILEIQSDLHQSGNKGTYIDLKNLSDYGNIDALFEEQTRDQKRAVEGTVDEIKNDMADWVLNKKNQEKLLAIAESMKDPSLDAGIGLMGNSLEDVLAGIISGTTAPMPALITQRFAGLIPDGNTGSVPLLGWYDWLTKNTAKGNNAIALTHMNKLIQLQKKLNVYESKLKKIARIVDVGDYDDPNIAPEAPFKDSKEIVKKALQAMYNKAYKMGIDHIAISNAELRGATWNFEYWELYKNQYDIRAKNVAQRQVFNPVAQAFTDVKFNPVKREQRYDKSNFLETDRDISADYDLTDKYYSDDAIWVGGVWNKKGVGQWVEYQVLMRKDFATEEEWVEAMRLQTRYIKQRLDVNKAVPNSIEGYNLFKIGQPRETDDEGMPIATLFQSDKSIDPNEGKKKTKPKPSNLNELENASIEDIFDDGVNQTWYELFNKEVPVFNPFEHIGKTIKPTFADLTDAGRMYTGIDSSLLEYPKALQGGVKFPYIQAFYNNGIVWASNSAGATTKLKKGDLIVVSAMTETSHISNSTVAQSYFGTVNAYIRDGRITKKQEKELVKMIKDGKAKAKEEVRQSLGYKKSMSIKALGEHISGFNRGKMKKIPVGVRNNLTESLKKKLVNYAEKKKGAKKPTPEEFREIAKALRAYMNDKTFEAFDGFSDIKKVERWIESITFEDTKFLMEIMDKVKAENLGAPSVKKVLAEILDKDASGYRFGDGLLVIEVDSDKETVVLGEGGLPIHRSYKMGVKGRVVGKLAKPTPMQILFPDFFAMRRADPKATESADPRSIQLSLPEQEITPELAEAIGNVPYETINSPAEAIMAQDFQDGSWADSNTPKEKKKVLIVDEFGNPKGVSIKDYEKAIRLSPMSQMIEKPDMRTEAQIKADLTKELGRTPTGKEVDAVKEIKNSLTVYKLGKSEVYFGLHGKYNYYDALNLSPANIKAMRDAGITESESAIVGMVNNQLGAKGIATTAIMLKAIQEGATVLDTYALKTNDFPDGTQDQLYSIFGFDPVTRIKFKPEDYTELELADLKFAWQQQGWKEGDPYPDRVVMKFGGTDDQRENTTERFIRFIKSEGEEGFRLGSDGGNVNATEEVILAGFSEADRETRTGERHSPDDLRTASTDNAIRATNRLGAILKELEGVTRLDRKRLGLRELGQRLNQPETDALKRGEVMFYGQRSATIRMLDASDFSTFLHETAHIFLEFERILSEKYGVTENQSKLMAWLGIESFDEIMLTSGDIERNKRAEEIHEKFAETFEVYLMQGQAPSVDLMDSFSSFKRFLTQIYKSPETDSRLRRADFNDEIKEVMDLMLATQDEMDEVTRSNEMYDGLFKSKEQAGMNDEEWEEYTTQRDRVKNRASENVTDKLVRQWLKRQTKEWRSERKVLIDNIKAELRKTREYQILSNLQTEPMDLEMVKDIMGWDKIPKSNLSVGKLKKDGVDPELYAQEYGYPSVRAMIKDLLMTEPLNKVAKEEAESMMINKYGQRPNEELAKEELGNALQNDELAKLAMMELRKLDRKNAIDRTYLKNQARLTISKMTYREIDLRKYERNMVKNAQKSATAKTNEERKKYKIQQLANLYLLREGEKAKKRMENMRKYVKKAQKAKFKKNQVEPSYAQYRKVLANLYRMEQKPLTQDQINDLVRWFETQADDENGFVPFAMFDLTIAQAMAQRAEDRAKGKQPRPVTADIPSFDDLSYEQLDGLYSQLKALRHIGGILTDKENAKTVATIDKMIEAVNNISKKDVKKAVGGKTKNQKRIESVREFFTGMVNLRNIVRKLDNWDEDGFFYNNIYLPLERASNRKLVLNRELHKRMEEELKGLASLGINEKKSTEMEFTLESGEKITLNAEKRFMFVVYMGTEYSYQALLEGYKLTDADAQKIAESLTEDQLKMVNAVWRANESLWSDLSKASVKAYGEVPPKEDPRPFIVNGVSLTGGHMRLYYDNPSKNIKIEAETIANKNKVNLAKTGSLFARTSGGGKPVLLDKMNIALAMHENVHFIAFADEMPKISRIIMDEQLSVAISAKFGEGFYRTLVSNVKGQLNNNDYRDEYSLAVSTFGWFRRALTMKYLAYNIKNIIQGFPSMITAMNKVGIGNYLKYASNFAYKSGREKLYKFINDSSPFMNDRASTVSREAQEVTKRMMADGKLDEWMQAIESRGFVIHSIVDGVIARPLWMSTYERVKNQKTAEGVGEDVAHEKAVSMADTAVNEAIGSGIDLHLGRLLQSDQTAVITALTMFGSWFNNYFNNMYAGSKGFTSFAENWAEGFRAVVIMPMMLATASALIVFDAPDWDDEEERLDWWIKEVLNFYTGLLPLVNQFLGAFLSDYSPRALPIAEAGATARRAYNSIGKIIDGDMTELETAKHAMDYLSTFVPIPASGNVVRVLDYMASEELGDEQNEGIMAVLQALTEGRDKNVKK